MFGSIARRLSLAAAVVALALAPVAASAQLLLGVSQPAAGGGGGAYVGPGDVVASAKVWVGLRAYTAAKAAAAAPLVKLVRTGDGHTCDALSATDGSLGVTGSCSTGGENGTAIATWCSSTCQIDTMYDQTGNGWNFDPNTTATRANLVFNCIGTRPCADFLGTAFYFSGITATADGLTVSTVAIRTGAFTSQNDILARGTAIFYNNAVNQVSGYGGNQTFATASDSTWHALQFVLNNTSSAIAVDATQTTGQNGGTTGMNDSQWLGSESSSGNNKLNGKITEIGMWPVAFTGTQMTNVCHNQFVYWGTPTSC